MLRDLIMNYEPFNQQEAKDKEVMLKYMDTFSDTLTRDNVFGHFTSSAFVINKEGTKVLMAYHLIYNSYAWLGGHVDGNPDTLEVAIKEAKEETSLKNLEIVSEAPISLEVIEVPGHFKKGVWITPHVHLNLTYLFVASDQEFIKHKEDENKSVKWLPLTKLDKYVKEEKMLPIYEKIITKYKNSNL